MVAREGWPWLIAAGVIGVAIYVYVAPLWALPVAIVAGFLYLLFRDPGRIVPAEPLAVVAPVDGVVIDVGAYGNGQLPGRWIRIVIKTRHLGAYTVRAPIEGAIEDVREKCLPGENGPLQGMWLCNEEEDDVVLLFSSRFRALAPRAFARYGERVGQGQRFAYLRLARRAEVYLPDTCTVSISKGASVLAGESILAELAQKRP